MNRRYGVLLVMAVFALTLTLGSFLLVRESRGPADVAAQEPASPWADRPEGWRTAILEAEDQAPKFDGEINGIRIAPTLLPLGRSLCGEGERAAYLETTRVNGDQVQVEPDYLPTGTMKDHESVVGCPSGFIIEHVIEYSVPTDADSARFGGSMMIARGAIGEARYALEAAAGRARATEVAGRPAALFEPLTVDGFGPSAVVIAEPFGVTTVQAYGITETELLRIAEGLYAKGASR